MAVLLLERKTYALMLEIVFQDAMIAVAAFLREEYCYQSFLAYTSLTAILVTHPEVKICMLMI